LHEQRAEDNADEHEEHHLAPPPKKRISPAATFTAGVIGLREEETVTADSTA
jgi:hypothetical protein